MRARWAEAEQLREELAALEAAGGERDPPFEHLTRRFGFFYVDALLRWTGEVVESRAGRRHTQSNVIELLVSWMRLLLSPRCTYGHRDRTVCSR